MADQFLGEIRIFAGNYEPYGWAFCDGRMLPVSQYSALYSLIGNIYGGDTVNFALPDLRGRIPVHQGQGAGLTARIIGDKAGVEQATLAENELPAHSHQLKVSTAAGTSVSPQNNFWAANINQYSTNQRDGLMNTAAIKGAGTIAVVAHENMMPSLCLNFIISLYDGIYPPRD